MSDLAERRRFGRALHDGVQQDLIALAVRLQLARGILATDAGEAAKLLDELRSDVHVALDSLRALAAEIYPPLLDARGLRDALATSPHVRVHGVGRHAPDLEAAVYFCCTKSDAEVDLSEQDGRLRVEFRGVLHSGFRELAEAAGAVFYESAR